ncbi:MAG: hypothetical protein RIT27_309 [Pseudomonadota bacterium]|jgi:tetratricopeptide (TPR) repeat protein
MLKYHLVIIFWLGLSVPQWAAADSSNAVAALLKESRDEFVQERYEQAAALLERALRIDPRNAILWHDLAGVRLKQDEWRKAMSLAAKSNELAIDNKWLRIRNWTLIALACEGLNDKNCAKDAQGRAKTLANSVSSK